MYRLNKELCNSCNGSGEGPYDGSLCGSCRGKGIVEDQNIDYVKNKGYDDDCD